MTLDGKRIVLVGGAGFIGHHLALALHARGAHVEIIDSLQVNNLLSLTTELKDTHRRELYLSFVNERLDLLRRAGVVLHPQDARDYHAVSRIISDSKPQVIVQLAAVAHANRSNKDPFSTFDHSLRTLENALDVAREFCDHFIYFSSSMVYGDFETESVTEEHPLNSIGIYGALKVAGEKIVTAYQQTFGLPYTIIRPSALYGPRCVSRRVSQVFIENAIRGEPVRLFGGGTDRLDFTYVDDLVEGVCLVIEKPASKNEVFNLTAGSARSISELLEITKSHFPDIAVESVERDKLMPKRGTLCVDKARSLLGYSPSNPLEVGFPKYVAWYREATAQTGKSRAWG